MLAATTQAIQAAGVMSLGASQRRSTSGRATPSGHRHRCPYADRDLILPACRTLGPSRRPVGVFLEFEKNLRRARQLESIAKAKAGGVSKGRPASIDEARVRELKAQGVRPTRHRQDARHRSHERLSGASAKNRPTTPGLKSHGTRSNPAELLKLGAHP